VAVSLEQRHVLLRAKPTWRSSPISAGMLESLPGRAMRKQRKDMDFIRPQAQAFAACRQTVLTMRLMSTHVEGGVDCVGTVLE